MSTIPRHVAGPAGRRMSLMQPETQFAPTRSRIGLDQHHKRESLTVDKNSDIQIGISHDHSTEKLRLSEHDDGEEEDDFLMTLNVGGRIFKTYRHTLLRLPITKLGLLARTTTRDSKEDIFFDRSPDMFEAILCLYRDDILHVPRHVCILAFCRELKFWGLSESRLSECCKKLYKDTIAELKTAEMMKLEFEKVLPHRAISSQAMLDTRRGRLWEFLDNPHSSIPAKIWFFCFYLFLLVSVANVFISTHPDCRVPIPNSSISIQNQNDIDPFLVHQAENNPKIRRLLTTSPHLAVVILELFCAVFFSVEFVLRAVVCPHKRQLFRSLLTWIDLLYLVPLWCELISSSVHVELWNQPEMLPGALALKTLMVLRVVRIFTLARHYRALRILMLSIKASLKEILLLFIFVLFAMIIYASLVYCAEIFTVDSSFDTLLTGLWWSLITMTTVGYGDVVPKSWAGYIVGSACAITGIIIIGMPVPIITSNFHLYYGYQNSLEDDEDDNSNNSSNVERGLVDQRTFSFKT